MFSALKSFSPIFDGTIVLPLICKIIPESE